MPFKLLCIAGARPNFMKLAPLLRELSREPLFSSVLVHTGQHYDEKMSGQFFRELGLPAPHYNLGVGSGSHAAQTAAIMTALEPVILAEQPGAVVVAGDVNSTLAGALVASKLGVPVAHIEAGLRSFDRSMPEEINRLVTDAVTDIFLVSEESGRRNLLNEGVNTARIHLVGNLMIDSLEHHLQQARQSEILARLGLNGNRYGVLTLHRPANVDEPGKFDGIMDALQTISTEIPLYFPVHPRTQPAVRKLISRSDASIHLLDPLGYVDFLGLVCSSALVLTDSGGIQEETTALGIPCLTLRDNTERPSTVEEGTNRLAGTTCASILSAWTKLKESPLTGRRPQYWDGHAAERSVEVLRRVLLNP